nr:hypothetical protein CFP56_76861 [Quercus suber]
MLGVNPEHANFHQVIKDDAAIFMTDLVQGHEEIHIYVDHPVDEPEELEVEDIESLEVLQLDYNHHASYYEDEVDSKGDVSDHYYDQATYEDDYHYNFDFHDNDDWYGQNNGDYRHDSDCESEELHSLDDSSFDTAQGEDDSDDDHPATNEVDNSVKRRKFPMFKPVDKAEHIRFKKDMIFTSPRQFKDAITDYAVNGGWGIRILKFRSKPMINMLE